jgi:hypothetical protein
MPCSARRGAVSGLRCDGGDGGDGGRGAEGAEDTGREQHGDAEARRARQPVAPALRADDQASNAKHKRHAIQRPLVFGIRGLIVHAGRRPARDGLMPRRRRVDR